MMYSAREYLEQVWFKSAMMTKEADPKKEDKKEKKETTKEEAKEKKSSVDRMALYREKSASNKPKQKAPVPRKLSHEMALGLGLGVAGNYVYDKLKDIGQGEMLQSKKTAGVEEALGLVTKLDDLIVPALRLSPNSDKEKNNAVPVRGPKKIPLVKTPGNR